MAPPLILSACADGRFAGMVIRELARRGAIVRGLVGRPERAEAAGKNGATEVAIGDLADPSSLETALDGIDSVFYFAPTFAPEEAKPGLNIIRAAEQAGAKRFVLSSVTHPASALENHPAKAPVEAALYGSAMEYVVLHPAAFLQNLAAAWPAVMATGIIAEPFSRWARVARVDCRDVAEAAAIALTDDRLNYGTFELCAGGRPNREDIAAVMSEVLGHRIEAAELTFEDWIAWAKPPYDDRRKRMLKAMYDFYGTHGAGGNCLVLRAILGREPRTLRAFVEELAHPPA